MSVLNQMIDLLRPTGLYRLAEDSHVMHELKAYAVGLERLAAAFDELIREAFIQTATGDGLTFWERKLHLSKLEGDTAARRRRLMGLLFLSDNDFTKADIISTLAALGANVSIAEDSANERLIITGKGYVGAGQDNADIAAEFQTILPAHLGVGLTIQIGSWYYWDSRGMTFYQWDQTSRSFADHAAAALVSVSY